MLDTAGIAADNEPGLTRRPGLPLFPASWYLFGESRELSRGPVSRSLLGRELVAFRAASGRAAVLDARCSHFGADLGAGKVVGDSIECPYHGWRYGVAGRCEKIPAGCAIPGFARQRSYPAVERNGFLFFFNGTEPSFPLPWFLDSDSGEPQQYAASRPFEFVAQSPWPSVTGHAFDLQHFLFVHDRRLLEDPTIDVPAPYVRRIRYRAEIVPRNWRDRVLARLLGREVRASLVVWGGTFAVITARFGRCVSRFMMVTRPIDKGRTQCEGIVFARRPAVGLGLRRYFTGAYLKEENRSLQGSLSMPTRFVESDAPLKEYFDFLAETLKPEGETL